MLAAPLRGRLALAACLAAAALLPAAARAADYPARDVRIIVPFPAGGTADIAARVVAAELGKAWGKAVVVDNKAGGGGGRRGPPPPPPPPPPPHPPAWGAPPPTPNQNPRRH
ncbi:hypothetical protein O9577_09635, partial [Achromobacter ruhlandii]|nr:hypothetical protein [Achromobacter ruhlandii]